MISLATRDADQAVALDGVSHINIDGSGQTTLGRQLDLLAHVPFEHPILGEFHSVEAFWTFIRSNEVDDEARYLYGMRAKRESIRASHRGYVDNFRSLIEEALYYKCVSRQGLLQSIRESVLPFDCYYIRESEGGERLKIERRMAKWIVGSMERVRQLIKEGRRPIPVDCSALLNRPRSSKTSA